MNTSNHFHALEMATFVPYSCVLTAPWSKSAAARGNPTSKKSGALNYDRLVEILAGTGAIYGGSGDDDDDDDGLPTIKEILYTTYKRKGSQRRIGARTVQSLELGR